jgi:hypothetical protein
MKSMLGILLVLPGLLLASPEAGVVEPQVEATIGEGPVKGSLIMQELKATQQSEIEALEAAATSEEDQRAIESRKAQHEIERLEQLILDLEAENRGDELLKAGQALEAMKRPLEPAQIHYQPRGGEGAVK